ncbi:hypothetical protein [Kribbella sp. NPDC049227]|uniref:hypothetical protein n=1 Tax=Kribbella sp. NPDC049227 TaxID=3364113 RepID=UPI00372267C1
MASSHVQRQVHLQQGLKVTELPLLPRLVTPPSLSRGCLHTNRQLRGQGLHR